MSLTFDSLTAQAMELPPEQRFELAQRLWQSVEGQVDEDEELFAKIARRDAEIEAGKIPTYSHEQVMRDAKKALGQ